MIFNNGYIKSQHNNMRIMLHSGNSCSTASKMKYSIFPYSSSDRLNDMFHFRGFEFQP